MLNRTAQLIRALRGPFLLITVGVMFWLLQSKNIRFGTTWPILIIVFGVMKLLEVLAIRAEPANNGAYGNPYGGPQS